MANKLFDRLFLLREQRHLVLLHRVVAVYTIVFLVWGLYRLLFRFPIWFEEVVLKAIVMGGIVFYTTFWREKRGVGSLGIKLGDFFPAVGFGLGLGVFLLFMGELAQFMRYGMVAWDEITLSLGEFGSFLALALVTAFWEELLMMGYVLQRLREVWKNEWGSVLVTAGLFVLLHVPMMVFVDKASLFQVLVRALLVFSLGIGNGIVMLRTGNLVAPILTHALWGVSIFLYR